MARNYYPIYLPFLRRTVEVDEQTQQSHAQQLVKVLKEWRSAKADAFCQCIGPNKVCFLHVRKVKENYYVARNSRTGHLHQDDCRFHGFNLGSTEHAYTAGVIEEDDDGHLRIRLDHGRRVGSPAASASTGVAPAAAQAAGGTGNARKRAMTLLGLLHLLWELGGIHRHRPQWNATRNWNSIGGRLVDAARTIVWAGASLGDALIVGDTPVPALDHRKHRARNDDVSKGELAAKQRVIFVGRPKSPTALQREGKLSLHGFYVPDLWLTKAAQADLVTRFARELKALQDGEHVYVAALAEPDANGERWETVKVVLMHVSERGVPLDSSLEGRVETMLAADSRSYRKPLRYDADNDATLPDFVLEDCTPSIPLEVFGRDEPEYVQRKQAKIRHYDAQYGMGGWWYWDATAQADPPPPFPPPS